VRATWWAVAVVAGLMVATACGSSAKNQANRAASATATVPGAASGDVLTFREVLRTIPYGSADASSASTSSGLTARLDRLV